MTKILYTVINQGRATRRGLSLREAAGEMLLYDGGDYNIRPGDDCGFWLWTERANRSWTRSTICSLHDDEDAAKAEIFQKVIDSGYWDSDGFTVIPDEQADAMLAEMGGDQ